MSPILKLAIGVSITVASAILLPIGPLTVGTLNALTVAAWIVWRLGILRSVLLGVGLLTLAVALTPPICSGGRARAYHAAMKSDLKNLASQQEIYFSDFGTYSASASDLGFVRSDGVVVTITAGAGEWAATAMHRALGDEEACAVRVVAGAHASARSGEIECTF